MQYYIMLSAPTWRVDPELPGDFSFHVITVKESR